MRLNLALGTYWFTLEARDLKIRKTLVLGIGNTLLTDEGVGVHLVEYLKHLHPDRDGIRFLDGGTLSFTLAAELEEYQNLIIVDAARTGGRPATVAVYEGPEVDQYLRGTRQSVHEVGLGDLLDIALLAGHFPHRVALVGIEPWNVEWGDSLSEPVAKSLPVAAEAVMALIAKWANEPEDPEREGSPFAVIGKMGDNY